jgi:RimJ/RimL family protein N-acetyltransferase
MDICENCSLHLRHQGDEQNICNPCKELARGELQVHVSPISREDLELILAWRSHPEIYRHFRDQTEPLTWSEHLSWFKSRDSTQHDFLIHYGGRHVGVVGLNTNSEITIYIADFSAQGEGVATAAINWLKKRFNNRTPLIAEVDAKNESSQHLFQKCGFRETNRSNGWIIFVYRS